MLRIIFSISIADVSGPYANGDFTFFVEIPKTYPFHGKQHDDADSYVCGTAALTLGCSGSCICYSSAQRDMSDTVRPKAVGSSERGLLANCSAVAVACGIRMWTWPRAKS